MTSLEFMAAQKKLGLNNRQMAEAIGVNRNEVESYRAEDKTWSRRPSRSVVKCVELLLELHQLRQKNQRTCIKCNETKPLNDFSKSTAPNICNECYWLYLRNRYLEKRTTRGYFQKNERRLYLLYECGLNATKVAEREGKTPSAIQMFKKRFEKILESFEEGT